MFEYVDHKKLSQLMGLLIESYELDRDKLARKLGYSSLELGGKINGLYKFNEMDIYLICLDLRIRPKSIINTVVPDEQLSKPNIIIKRLIWKVIEKYLAVRESNSY